MHFADSINWTFSAFAPDNPRAFNPSAKERKMS